MQKPTIADCVKALTPNELTIDQLGRRMGVEPSVLLPILQTGGGLGYVRCGKSNGQMFWSAGATPAPPPPLPPRVREPKREPGPKRPPRRTQAEMVAQARLMREAKDRQIAERKKNATPPAPVFGIPGTSDGGKPDAVLQRITDLDAVDMEPVPDSVAEQVFAMVGKTAFDPPPVKVELEGPTDAARRALHRLRNKSFIFRPYVPPQPELSAQLMGEDVWLSSKDPHPKPDDEESAYQLIVLRMADVPALIQALTQLKAAADA